MQVYVQKLSGDLVRIHLYVEKRIRGGGKERQGILMPETTQFCAAPSADKKFHTVGPQMFLVMIVAANVKIDMRGL